MKVAPLFHKLQSCDKKFIVLQGGGDAGKTVTALQHLAISGIKNPGEIITVTGQDVPNLKKGALRQFQRYVYDDPQIRPFIKSYNATDRVFTLYNKSIIEFLSFDGEQDARGSERDRLFINECNSKDYNFFWQLQRKTRKQTIVDYNPTSRFWVHEKLIGKEFNEFTGKVQLYITDHRHNPFLSEEDHQAYESITDPDMFRVYSRGLTGKVKGLIYGHFRPVDKFPEDCSEIIYGIDYGYTNDPTALVKIGIRGRQRYVQELLYAPGVTAERIKEVLIAAGYRSEVLYSEHDTNMIAQLRRLGIPVVAARKGPGSIAAGNSKVRSYECFYTADSHNLKKEIESYKFMMAQDINSGKEIITNVPVDGNDHLCNALTYGIYSHSFHRLDT